MRNLTLTGIGLGVLAAFPHDAQAEPGSSPAITPKTTSGLRRADKETGGDRVVYSAQLKESRKDKILVKLIRSGDENGVVTAKFVCTDRHGRAKVFYRKIGDVLGDKYSAEAVDYIGSGRKQVLVTAGTRAHVTCIIDCDGMKLRTLYEEFCLYVPAMVHTRKNRWLVEEVARADSIGCCQGTYYRTDDDGLVIRLLKWNGKMFTPLEPGRSHIVVTSYAHYLRSHGIPTPGQRSRAKHYSGRRMTTERESFCGE